MAEPSLTGEVAEMPGLVADLVELTKPRIMLLLQVTMVGAMAWAAGGLPDISVLVAAVVGMGLASGGGSALNHAFDRDLDRLMTRTATRPVASGRIAPAHAIAFGLALNVLAVPVLWIWTTPVATAFALGGSAFYAVVYTLWLKRTSKQNIVIGGAAGAAPPLVGWAAVTGDVAWPPVLMFLVVFLWTPPHFWALALLKKDEYARAGIPMLPVVAGDRATAIQILAYTVVLVVATVVPVLFGTLGPLYLVAALALGGWFMVLAIRLLRAITREHARATFLYSLLYLALLFAAMGVDRAIA